MHYVTRKHAQSGGGWVGIAYIQGTTTTAFKYKILPCMHCRYINVYMEFDTKTLKPTYRLCWGAAGASNAIAIATALGFDSAVLREASAIMADNVQRQQQEQGRIAAVAKSLMQQLEDTKAQLEKTRGLRQRREAELQVPPAQAMVQR